MANKKRSGWSEDISQEQSHNPFAALLSKKESLPPAQPVLKEQAKAEEPAGPKRALLRTVTKARGGKTVTLIEQLDLPKAELKSWCKTLKKRLGVGGAVEEDCIVLQGEDLERTEQVLKSLGVQDVRVA